MNDIAAVPWYMNEENYEAFRSTAVDQADFFESHAEWLEAALEHERQAEKYGVTIVRVRMDPAAFAVWCAEQSRANDADARSEFAELRAARMVRWLGD
ncbi:MAG: hypothetical protein ACKO0N_07835 [Planctomycetota bacterium]